MSRIVVVGQGYVGLPLALRAVEVGHDVVGFDTDEGRTGRLAAGASYVEDVTAGELKAALRSGRYRPTSDPGCLAGFDLAVITVPTPLRDGAPDLSFIEQAASTVASHLRPGACVVLESTTYPGTTVELLVPILESISGLRAGPDFCVGYSPERIDPGNQVWRLTTTPKVVSGIDERSLGVVDAFYSSIVERTVPVPRTEEAELVKLIENTFRHVNVALVNELAMFAGDLGVDIWRALDAAATKPFGFLPFRPGPGVGGHCLPVDPSYLSWQVKRRAGESFRFVELANDINDHMPAYVVRRLMLAFNRRDQALRRRRVLLVGLAYKRNTSDARESPALVVADLLTHLGVEVVATDPHVDASVIPGAPPTVELSAEELKNADAVVLLVAHDAFDLELVVEHAQFVFDTQHCIDGPQVEHL